MVDEKTTEEALNMMSQVGAIAVQFKDTMGKISKTLDTLTEGVEAGTINANLLSIGYTIDETNKTTTKVIKLLENLLNSIFLNLAVDANTWGDFYQETDTKTK